MIINMLWKIKSSSDGSINLKFRKSSFVSRVDSVGSLGYLSINEAITKLRQIHKHGFKQNAFRPLLRDS